ncbi:rhodanese-like domain-containing protein [Lutibaculum baratangense]|uniref:Rhodanese-related sulfurtransferase n=1 Tax=Lutibaculum baratangense AMV1 TaxID=631454 RepID=V4RJ49_9HYPH|nr:rhodanese-like domain-containing protein [Lutibaculum baratangense]ESR26111.1 Rhodanese-related sulfurtransferase [Lutibaculum baratangense AMV1]
MTRQVPPAEAKARVHGGGEIAFLDVREAGQFGEGHPLFAVPCPYSRLESLSARLVPNPAVPVVLIDAGDGLAEKAGERLRALGYADVSRVEGGAPGWQRAGFTLFKGVNVPSKTLGELAEHEWHPRTVDAERLREWQAEGRVRLFDGRPPSEYAKMHVPGAVCMPNGELAHRIDLVADGEVPVVVGCAGRTRGLVGAIGLGLMGYSGEVYALENGTQGWALAGQTLERGVAAAPLPELDVPARARARERATAFMARWGIPSASAADLSDMVAETGRTTFVFDVRSAEEAAQDPIEAARHALSGQLVQSTDQFVGVRHARIVLCDDEGVRAALAAFWLRQLGFDPVVVLIDDAVRALPATRRVEVRPARAHEISPADALRLLGDGRAQLVDLRASNVFREGHVEGATWAMRCRLASLTGKRRPVLIADDEEVLAGALRELEACGLAAVSVVRGGHAALVAAGATEVRGAGYPSDEEAIDFLRFVHDRHDGNLEASRRYLAWEQGLIAQLDPEERREFRPAADAGS